MQGCRLLHAFLCLALLQLGQSDEYYNCKTDDPPECLMHIREELSTSPQFSSSFYVATFSHTGAYIALGSSLMKLGDRVADVWVLNSTDGTTLYHFVHEHDQMYSTVRAAAFSPDDRLLATGADRVDMRVWDLAKGTDSNFTFDGLGLALTSRGGCVVGVGFTADGKNVLGAGYDARAWNLESREQYLTVTAPDKMFGFAVSRRSSIMVTYSVASGLNMVLTSAINGTTLATWQGPCVPSAFTFSPDDTRLVYSCMLNGNVAKVFVVVAMTGKVLLTLTGHTSSIYDCAYSPDGKYLATAGGDKSARLWSAETGDELYSFPHSKSVTSVDFAPDGRVVSVAGDVWVWKYTPATPTPPTAVPTPAPPTLHPTAAPTQAPPTVTPTAVPPTPVPPTVAPPPSVQCKTDDPPECLMYIHEGQASSSFYVATFSHDGAYIALGSMRQGFGNDDADVWVLDSTAGTTLHHFTHEEDVSPSTVRAAAFSPDDKLLATGADMMVLRVWDLAKGTVSNFTFDAGGGIPNQHELGVFGVGFTPDGKNVFGAGYDARAWKLESGEQYLTVTAPDKLASFGVSRNGSIMVTYNYYGDSSVVLTSTIDGKTLATWKTTCAYVPAFAFSPDASRLLYSCSDIVPQAFVVVARTGKVLLRLTGHTSSILDCAYSHDGKYLATAGNDTSARLWSAETGDELYSFPHPSSVTSIDFGPDGRVVSAASDVWVWKYTPTPAPPTAAPSTPFPPTDAPPLTPAPPTAAPPPPLYPCKTDDPPECLMHIYEPQLPAFYVATFSHTGAYIALGSSLTKLGDRVADVWVLDSTDGITLHHFVHEHDKMHSTVRAAAFSPDDKLIATGANMRVLRVWDLAKGTDSNFRFDEGGWMPPIPEQNLYGVIGVGFTPDGKNVLGAGSDARAWNLESGEQYLTVTAPFGSTDAFAVSKTGSIMATTTSDSRLAVVLTSTIDGTTIATWRTWCLFIVGLAFSPDDSRLLYSCSMSQNSPLSSQGSVVVARTGEVLLTLTGHTSSILDCAYSHDGKYLATAGDDKSARLWSAETGDELYSFPHSSSVTSIDFAPDGRVVSVAGDVWVWKYTPPPPTPAPPTAAPPTLHPTAAPTPAPLTVTPTAAPPTPSPPTVAPTAAPPTTPPTTVAPTEGPPLAWQLPTAVNASVGATGRPVDAAKVLGLTALQGDAFDNTLFVYVPHQSYVVDVGDAASPRIVSAHSVPYGECNAFDMMFTDNTQAVLRCDNELWLVDFRDQVATYTHVDLDLPGGSVAACTVSGKYVFLATTVLVVAQVQNASLALVGTLGVPAGAASGLHVVRDAFLLWGAAQQLAVFDIASHAGPALLKVHTADTGFAEMVVIGSHAYVVASPPSGIAVYDVADPRAWGTHIDPVAHAQAADGYFWSLSTAAGRLLLSDMHPRPPVLVEADVADPAAPRPVVATALRGVPSAYVSRPPYVYVAYDAERSNYAVGSLVEVLAPSAVPPETQTPVPATATDVCACRATFSGRRPWVCSPRNGSSGCYAVEDDELCEAGFVKCSHPSANSTNPFAGIRNEKVPGLHCLCQSYQGHANQDDGVLCRTDTTRACSLPHANGTCPAGAGTLCSVNKLVRVGVHVLGTPIGDVMGELVSVMRDGSVQFLDAVVKPATACPASVCLGGVCAPSIRARLASGCMWYDSDEGVWTWPASFNTSSMNNATLVYLDFAILLDEPQRSSVLQNFLNLVDTAQTHPELLASRDLYVLVKLLGVTEAFTVLRPIIRSLEAIWDDIVGWWSRHMVWLALFSTVLIVAVVVAKRVRFSEMVNFSASRVRVKRGMEGSLRSHGERRRNTSRFEEELFIDGQKEIELDIDPNPGSSPSRSNSSSTTSSEGVAI